MATRRGGPPKDMKLVGSGGELSSNGTIAAEGGANGRRGCASSGWGGRVSVSPSSSATWDPLSRRRRMLVARRSQAPNQAQEVIDRGGVRIGAVR